MHTQISMSLYGGEIRHPSEVRVEGDDGSVDLIEIEWID